MIAISDNIRQRFIAYTRFNTQSDDESTECPSTTGQMIFAEYLVQELRQIGLQVIMLDNNGYVMATLPANVSGEIPIIGFIAHLDTSDDLTGANVQAQIVSQYDGQNIMLNAEKNIEMSIKDFPELGDYIGDDIITTDGTTLLGADDKAGICEIITAMEYLINHPEFKHGTIKIAFTPDEEIGRGADLFDVRKFGADFAFTVDGGAVGELQYETFNAAEAKLKIRGRNVHPGHAKNKMINALLIAMELNSLLPSEQIPATTEGYEGFFHLRSMSGSVEEASMYYLIRDHDTEKFAVRKQILTKAVSFLNDKYGVNTVTLSLEDRYYNMKEKIIPVMHIVKMAEQAMKENDIEPKIYPIRGGTDGAKLSFMGLPCPNLFTGGHNFHGKYEFIPVSSMKKAVQVILGIIEINSRSKSR